MATDKDIEKTARRNEARSKPPKSKVAFGDYHFCRIELTADEKADLRENYLPDNNPLHVLTDLTLPGYKLSVTYDKDGKTTLASLTCTAAADTNAGLTITARAGNVSAALIVLGYKVLIICDDRPWAQVEHERGGSYNDIG